MASELNNAAPDATQTDAETEAVTDKHIVDVLIEERAAELIARPWLWRLLRPTILPILGYRQAIEAVDYSATLSGLEIFHYVSDRIRMNVLTEGLHNIPAEGGAVISIRLPLNEAAREAIIANSPRRAEQRREGA